MFQMCWCKCPVYIVWKNFFGKQRYQYTNFKATSVLNFTYNAYKQEVNKNIIQLTKEGLGICYTARFLKISPTTLLSHSLKS